MGTKHPYADVIKAWADGADIEQRLLDSTEWKLVTNPSWATNLFEYRIKQEPVITVLYFQHIYNEDGVVTYVEFEPDLEPWDLKITYEDGKVVKVEFPR
jgi:hypothetical protein